MIKILFFGDIFGRPGRNAIKKILPELKEKYRPDLVIANGENLAHGNGVTTLTVKEMTEAGIQIFTGGNHTFDNTQEAEALLSAPDSLLLRPANYPQNDAGKGAKLVDVNGVNVLVFNLMGRVFIKEDLSDPFSMAQQIVDEYKDRATIFILDFHAEATSEKIALGHYLDGKVSAIFGTHTHVPTEDYCITKNGTAYVTDVGMVGPHDSVIGLTKDSIITQYLTQIRQKHDVPEKEPLEVNAIYLEIDEKNGKTTRLEKIRRIIA